LNISTPSGSTLARAAQTSSSFLAIASYSDPNGEWVIDQATLQRRTRLSNRYVRQILTRLSAEAELAVVSHHGRGKLSTYRLLVGPENWRPSASFPAGKAEPGSQFSSEKPAPESQFPSQKPAPQSQFPSQKPEAESQFSGEKPEAESQFSAPLAPPSPPLPPFPPDPLIPLYPQIPLTPPEKQKQETFGLRPLPGPQSAVFRVNLLLEEAGVPLPSPGQIGLWSKKLGGIESLLELLGRLVQAGLANKREPMAYIHRVVMEQAARPDTTGPRKALSARAGRELLWAAGSDEIRRQQALEIIAETEES
jgi:hypothetical protein